jgi:serine/threonine protein kinase
MRAYDMKCDIWSVGVITSILLFKGQPPFNGMDNQEILFNISQGNYSYSESDWELVPQVAQDFVKSLLTHDLEKRSSIQEALRHPWLLDQQEFVPDGKI